METATYHLNALQKFLEHHKVSTLDQPQQAFDDSARCTVFRKLKELEYFTTYSNHGKYYTLGLDYRVAELKEVLYVRAKFPLIQLFRWYRLQRQQFASVFVHLSGKVLFQSGSTKRLELFAI
jgi:hypothetical protein